MKRTNLGFTAFFAASLLTAAHASAQTPTHGHIEGNTYIDERFGMRYTFPTELQVMHTLNGMGVGDGSKQGESEFLLSAMEAPNGHVRRGVFVTSDPWNAFAAASTEQYLRASIANSIRPKKPFETSAVTMAGQMFQSSRVGIDAGPVHAFGAQFATVCNGRFLGFYFIAESQEEVDALATSMKDMTLTCGGNQGTIVIAVPKHKQ